MCWALGRRMARGKPLQQNRPVETEAATPGTGPGPHLWGIRGTELVSRGPFSLETLWGCSEPCLESTGGPLHPPKWSHPPGPSRACGQAPVQLTAA